MTSGSNGLARKATDIGGNLAWTDLMTVTLVTGAFATINGHGRTYMVIYNPNDLTLVAQ